MTRKKWLIGGGISVCLLLLALLGMWASGVFMVKTPEGTIVLENLPPDAEVLVDGAKVIVKWDKGGKSAQIRVPQGRHKIEATKDGITVIGEEVEIEDGKRRILTAKLVRPPKPPQPDPPQDADAGDEGKGFKPLFNGKDLAGWTVHPRQRAGNWRVVNGTNGNVLTGSGPASCYLYSESGDYKDFRLRVEARINDGGNSGVYFRAPFGFRLPADYPAFPIGYEAQINSTHPDVNKTGSLYGAPDGILVSVGETLVLAEQWFKMEVIAQGNHIIVKVNGKETANIKDEKRRFNIGHIALQQHNPQTVIEFRKIEIKELPPVNAQAAPVPGAADEDKGFKPLLNGKDKAGLSVDGGPSDRWIVDGNTIVGRSDNKNTRTYLLTDKEYSDFVLRFDFLAEEANHGGVAIRASEGEKLPINNIVIFDHPLIKLTNPAMEESQPTGTSHWLKSAALGVRPLQVLPLPTRTWHSMEVVVRGENCTANVNGKKIVDITLDPDPRNRGNIIPGLGRRKGKVGFQINTGTIRYSNIKIKELPAAKPQNQRPAGPAGEENDFKPLFNGKDLTGWTVLPKQRQSNWRVVNGTNGNVLTGSGPALSHLYTERGDFKDFRLRVEARINDGGQGGVFFRARFGLAFSVGKLKFPWDMKLKSTARIRMIAKPAVWS